MDIGTNVFGFAALLFILGYLSYIIYYALGLFQINPFVQSKPLSLSEKSRIAQSFPIYRNLPADAKKKCDKRIAWYRSKKKFILRGNIANAQDVKLMLSATIALLTLGMRNFKMMNSLLRIVVYPSQYYSKISRKHHLGEYNPRFRTAVFSAEELKEGFKVPNDNRNLSVHEFAHALTSEMMRKNSWEARKFKVGLKKIKQMFTQEDFYSKVNNTDYFRAYGQTNLHEFFSVAVENFIETPEQFKKEFPELYRIIKRMLNFNF